MTPNEYESHFALWALMKAPLLIGCDLTPEGVTNTSGWNIHTQFVLLNKELIAINQDPLGVAGDLIWKEGPNEIWAGPLDDGSRVVVLFNRHVISSQYPLQNITVNFTQLGYPEGVEVMVRDLYLHQDMGNFTHSFTGIADIHGCVAIKVTPVTMKTSYRDWRPWDVAFCNTEESSSSTKYSPWYYVGFVLAVLLLSCFVFIATRTYYKNKLRHYEEHAPLMGAHERQETATAPRGDV
jgi:hypothetical protein